MGRCRDCRWWERKPEQDQLEGQRFGWGKCLLMLGISGEATHSESLAYAEDLEMCSAWVNTAPEFGCVQFEAKEQG